LESFGFCFFEGDIIRGIGLGILAQVIVPGYCSLVPMTRANFLLKFLVDIRL